MTRGVLYVAYGNPAKSQGAIALWNLSRVHPDWPAAVVTDAPFALRRGTRPPEWIVRPEADPGARQWKLMANLLSPFDETCYYDVDTRIRYSIESIWEPLDKGWDLVLTPCAVQCRVGFMKHVLKLSAEGEGKAEKDATLAECGWPLLGFQGGLVAFRDAPIVHEFFATWRNEWQRWGNQDQGALIRALRQVPIKALAVSRAYNGGALVGHYHAHARRRSLEGSIA